MPCAVGGCAEGPELKTDPCSVCGKPTHHMCAISVFDGENSALNERYCVRFLSLIPDADDLLSRRFCSQSCVLTIYPSSETSNPAVVAAATRPAASATASSTNIWTGPDSDFVPSPEVGPGLDTTTTRRPSKRRKIEAQGIASRSAATTPRVDATEVPPPPSSPVSDLGVPLSVSHSRKVGATDPVWDLIHVYMILCVARILRAPQGLFPAVRRDLLPGLNVITTEKTNVAIYLSRRLPRVPFLVRFIHKSKHGDHLLAVLAEQNTAQKATTDVLTAEADAEEVLDLTGGSGQEPKTTDMATTTTTCKTPQRFFKASERTLHVLISKWLITQGIPFPACRSAPFQDMMRAATGDPAFSMLSRDRHDRLLQEQFQLFCDLVENLLSSEYKNACHLQYLNLMHDIWTSCGKDSIVGASVAFIDTSWRFRFIATLATVKNDGHNAPLVAKVIESGFKAKYDIDIRAMTRFTMSDTTPSARNVADHIESEQEDCSMHLLNLCIGYGLGVKDNIQTNSVWNAACHSWDKVVTIVTPGGTLEEGGEVIQKLRNLNNHFRSPKQRNALKKIQEALSYPELEPMIDKDVRVAYTCKLIRRSVVHYAAFEAYFQSTKESRSAWSALSADDWMLATEMESVTHFIANLALVEAQSENLVSSYMVVFRRLAEKKLKSFKFDAMVIEAPRAKDGNETSHRRVVRRLDQFSEAGKTCLRRTLLQLQARFPKVTKEAMACILLDPRTKSSAKKIAAVGDIPRKEEKAIYKNDLEFLRNEHRKVFSQMGEAGQDPTLAALLAEQSTQPGREFPSVISVVDWLGVPTWDDEDELLLGAPIRTSKTREEVKESEINARADSVMMEWLEMEPEWLDVAQHQNPDIKKEDLSSAMTTDSRKGMPWSLLGLYKYVDVLQWFRDEGESRFPSMALLSRIHLGKISSSAFQERVFSTGGIIMGPLRTRTDNRRSEKQLLLRHNRDEIVKMKQDARKAQDASKDPE
ncbi:hypothetical protein DVH05_020977 [Phytophthora capsici]|nr:hypothetical protein DVH05_020977 [Phytophthora capsici]